MQTLRTLFVEDRLEDVELIRIIVACEGIELLSTVVMDISDFDAQLQHEWDIILCDFTLVGSNAFDYLKMARSKAIDIPFVVISGSIGEELAVECIKAGATDCILKHNLKRLVQVIRRAIEQQHAIRERKAVEQKLKEAETRFSRAFLLSPVATSISLLTEGTFLDVNEAWLVMFGYTREEVIGKKSTDLGIWADPTQRLRVVKDLFKFGKIKDVEGRFRHKDGGFGVGLCSAETMELGGQACAISLFHDITERKAREDALKLSESRFRQAFKHAAAGIALTNLDGSFISINSTYCKILGYTEEEILDPSFRPRTHPADIEPQRMLMEDLLHHSHRGFVIEKRYYNKTGEIVWVRNSVSLNVGENGEPLHIIRLLEDITERKRGEQTIREQAALLDKTQDAILVTQLDHRLYFVNKGAERLYGWDKSEMLGKKLSGLVFKDPKVYEEALAITKKQGEWIGTLDQVNRSGKEISVESRWTLVRDESGQPASILSINTDVTEKKRVEAQYFRAQRLESLGTLASGIAHDLNNVLSPILMSIGLLKEDAAYATNLRILETIELSALRGADMVKQVLSFARGVEGKRLLIEPGDLIRDVLRILRDTFPKSIALRTKISGRAWSCRGDTTQLHQVLLNLCVNARDAMPGGGTLTMSAENLTIDDQYASIPSHAKPGNYLLLTVSDTGVGIPPALKERIFEPFFTTKEQGKGTGLGLATVQTIVMSHGGFVTVYSEPGQGTVFRIHLPAQSNPGSDTKQNLEAEFFRGAGETILVVDDEASILNITQRTLEAFGYQVLVANDGTEALAIFAEQGNKIAVVLTDMMMPFLDGPSTIQILRKMKPKLNIIATSGLSQQFNFGQETEEGVTRFLSKPYTSQILLKTLHEILHPSPT
ncbi:MAG: Multi-sensor hybrid histidine kinase [Verrucomicrobiales bacterium]|nr:Multi-sensor hybrid histidine kinase [Verrucomicrobiales bacterium]